MEPYIYKNDRMILYKYLDKAKNYFEYGSGGSTYQAYIRKNIENIYSVESDLEWHNKIKTQIVNNKKINYIYNEMDTQPNTWGNPGPNATIEQQINYSNQIKLLDKNKQKKIDLILIDGRFRVACCLKCFDIINNKCFIAFDDFLNRSEYECILKFYKIYEKSKDNCMVILQKKNNINRNLLQKLISKYELIPK